MRRLSRLLLCLGTWAAIFPLAANGSDHPVVFNRDIRPILSDNCLHCHGFDAKQRKADLRLDTAEGAREVRDGRAAIKDGDLAGSELWRRITSKDPAVVMPPPESGKQLKPEHIDTLREWIKQGAKYQKHWAFEPISAPQLPRPTNRQWAANPLDLFILSTLEGKQLAPSPRAPKETLIRRVTLDLTGLPPTPAEVDAFVADARPEAYPELVSRLLASSRYGEHMARYWLDLARYGDTHGLHLDNERSLWPYRDWVVEAFNTNLSFDQFTIWQLAGDLLPNPTREQLVASGFNRCNVTTSEGGAIDEEFQVRYAVDRVETTSTVWMGLTMGCASCHDHKLDPITQKEFYQVFSIFNNISEKAMDGNALLPPPILQLPSPGQEKTLAEIKSGTAELEAQIRKLASSIDYQDPALSTNAPKVEPVEKIWIDDTFPAGAQVQVNAENEPHRWVNAPVYSGTNALRRAGKGLHQTFFANCNEPLTINPADRIFAYVFLQPEDLPKAIMLQFHSDGWKHRAIWGDPDAIPYGTANTPEKVVVDGLPEAGKWIRLELDAARLGLNPGTRVVGMAFTQTDGTAFWDKAGQLVTNDPAQDPKQSLAAWHRAERALGNKSTAPSAIKELLKKPETERDAAAQQKLREYYLEQVHGHAELDPLRDKVKELASRRDAVQKEIPATLISHELDKPRPAWVLLRGEYDKHGEPVGPGVPAILPPLPESEKTNRLSFARWLVDPAHPLTARVTVNRFWQQFFGVGLVKTSEDFGTKGEWPSHPELLDWLADHFVKSGWDVKELVRLVVTSAAYQQDSRVTPEVLKLDPENRLLARGPRFRLDAETIRDSALYVSGLLNPKMGGRGVRTYQPPGIWEAVGYTTSNTAQYSQDKGDALYRRSLYLFWKRTAPPPSMTTFDAPSREQCRSRRERTNTPLQALLTMNDVQFVEAARHLGHRMLRQGGPSDAEKLQLGFQLATARVPDAAEQDVLGETLAASRAHYSRNLDEANKLVRVGDSPLPADVPVPELAAYTVVANLLLNLDETLTRN